MSYGSSAHTLPCITNYKQADKLFNDTKAPRSTAKWQRNQRPLKDNRSYHYRIEQHNDGQYYDVCLYSTVMARFYAPEADGSERRLFNAHTSITSKAFMWHVLSLGHTPKRITTEGINVVAPVYTRQFIEDDGDKFSAEFRFVNDMLDVSRSMHTPHYRQVSNKADRDARAEAKQIFEPLVTLACMRMGEFAETCELQMQRGSPFSGVELTREQHRSVHDIFSGNLTEQDTNNFMGFAKQVYEGIASKRAWHQGLRLSERWYNNKHVDTVAALTKPVTEKDLATSLHKHISDILGLSRRSGSEELPQFMPVGDYPSSNVSTFSR